MQRTRRAVSANANAETGWTRGPLLEGKMAWPNDHTLPFISWETVWRVYELSDDGSNPTRTLKCLVCYKDGGTVNGYKTALEYMGFPSNVAKVEFKASTGYLEFEKDTSFANPVPLTGSGSLHTSCVAAFGPSYKRFKGTVTRANIHDLVNDGAFSWSGFIVMAPGPQLDPGTHTIRDQNSGYAIAGVSAKYVSGPDVPTSGNDRTVKEAIIVSTVGGAAPTPTKFRALKSSTGDDPTQYSSYSSNLESGSTQQYVFEFDSIVISSTWN